MLPAGMPSWALIWAYDRGWSPVSRAISCWQQRGRRVNASRSAASRSAASSSCSAVGVCASGMLSASSTYPAACGSRAARRARAHSRRVVVASQPGQRGRLAEFAQVVEELEPDCLADVVGIGAAQLVPAADRPDQRGVPLDQGVPRPLVAVRGAGYPRQ